MARLRRALEGGWDLAELTEQYNAAVAEKRAVEAELSAAPRDVRPSRDDLLAALTVIGDQTDALGTAEPHGLAELYSALRLSMVYHHAERAVDVSVQPTVVVKSGVRGGT